MPGDTSWFVRDRFGMFLHWGLYALPARGEWVRTTEGLSDVDYQRYFDRFDPDLYDPAQWAANARAAGVRYVVITAKHHDGFCLWDSAQTDFKSTNTPCRKDLLRSFVDAFRAEGLRVGFYYSLLDWHHPDFPVDAYHPLGGGVAKRMVEGMGEEFSFETLAALPEDIRKRNEDRDIRVYAAYVRAQVRELLTGYGRIDVMWFDFSYPGAGGLPGKGRDDWESARLLELTRELAPHAIVNDRLDLPADHADVHTPEQVVPKEWVRVDGAPVVWEACHTFSGSWGYHRDEASWKSPQQLVRLLVETVACGGNLLMNVGPTGRGTFDRRSLDALACYGDWLRLHGRAIYDCTASEFTPPADCRYTQRGDRLYLHVFAWPCGELPLGEAAGQVAYAQLLDDASEIPLVDSRRALKLPVRRPDVLVPVVELFLRTDAP
ncbi:alpha-L-fucosidase [Lentzea sp. NPDC051213]|uniref:alpha-L-fucosidase n=1 Tax=Lentzea sp. NPDC051213 TaxID=3364126 RepID=UPI0037BC190D